MEVRRRREFGVIIGVVVEGVEGWGGRGTEYTVPPFGFVVVLFGVEVVVEGMEELSVRRAKCATSEASRGEGVTSEE